MLSIKGGEGLNNKNWKKEYAILAKTMDDYCGKEWRTDKKIVRRIKSAAKKKCNL